MVGLKFRRFSIADSMILVAATAAGMAWGRLLNTPVIDLDELSGLFTGLRPFGRPNETRLRIVLGMVLKLYYLVATWTFGFLVLRVRSPRPILRRLARQPGFAAGCAVTVAFIVGLGEHVAWQIAQNGVGRYLASMLHEFELKEMLEDAFPYWEMHGVFAGSVGAVWGVMALGRSLRPERSWIDRGGRVLGCLWLLLYAVRLCILDSD